MIFCLLQYVMPKRKIQLTGRRLTTKQKIRIRRFDSNVRKLEQIDKTEQHDEEHEEQVKNKHIKNENTKTNEPTKRKKKKLEKTCPECSRILCDLSALNKHLRSFHRKERPFLCNTCNRSFAAKQSLQKHQEKCANKVLSMFYLNKMFS